jgi:hypothetical protein
MERSKSDWVRSFRGSIAGTRHTSRIARSMPAPPAGRTVAGGNRLRPEGRQAD